MKKAIEKLRVLESNNTKKILSELAKESPLPVNEIVDRTKLLQPAVSRHLSTMKKFGFVVSEREGANVYYASSPVEILRVKKHGYEIGNRTIKYSMNQTCKHHSGETED